MNFQKIPQELIRLPQWVCYKTHKKKPKVPFNPTTGKPAVTTSPSTWGDFQTTLRVYEKGGYEGIGFVFSKSDPFIGIDLDECRDPETGSIETWAQDIIKQFNSYTEISPSGTGVHIIINANLPKGIGGRRKGNIEVYQHSRYFTMTGRQVK